MHMCSLTWQDVVICNMKALVFYPHICSPAIHTSQSFKRIYSILHVQATRKYEPVVPKYIRIQFRQNGQCKWAHALRQLYINDLRFWKWRRTIDKYPKKISHRELLMEMQKTFDIFDKHFERKMKKIVCPHGHFSACLWDNKDICFSRNTIRNCIQSHETDFSLHAME